MSQINKITQQGFRKAEKITKQYAKTFYFASRFLPEEKRKAAYAVYAICRLSDDAVDTADGSYLTNNINQIKEDIEAVYSNGALRNNVLVALQETVNKYNIPKYYFDQLLEGMAMDLAKKRYENFDELHLYCYRVAGVVGLIMLKIFGSKDPSAQQHAIDLGIAMQLTNILRDIKEDYQRGRIYLPQDEMDHFGISEKHISKAAVDDRLISFLKFQIQRARNYYDGANQGINKITSSASRFVTCAMKDMYAAILSAIEKNGFDVFSQRAHVNNKGKTLIALKILFTGQFL